MGFKQALAARIKGWSSGNWSSGGWDGNNLSIFNPDHPLNRAARWSTSGLSTNREQIENDFEAYIQGAYKANGPVFAVATARQLVFSEAVFKFKNVETGKLHGKTELELLEKPWPGGTTQNLLSRMEQDASLAGNSWWTITNDEGQIGRRARGGTNVRLAHLRPDWVTMVIGTKKEGADADPRAIDSRLLGIAYQPLAKSGGGPGEKVYIPIEDVAHYAPIPDPAARFGGMSWMTPVLRTIEADKSAEKHKAAFFDNAAVPNMAVTLDKDTSPDDFEEFVDLMEANHTGSWNAYKTLYLAGGADVTPLSHDFKALDFTNIVGKDESRIASAAGVPPSWVGFSEGMQGSALNSGNMAANRRRFADGTIRPLWREAVGSLATLLDVPTDSVLWWDESGIAFLREDQRDRAEIMRIDMQAVNTGILAGYEPDAVLEAVAYDDILRMVGKHTGLVSVQMQPPVENNHDKEDAAILEVQARAIDAFINGGFTEESSRDAVASHDLSKLKKDPAKDLWSPSGAPLPPETPAGGAKPPTAGAPAKPPAQSGQQKPPKSPGGGGNG
ncbi:phage portal protein [Streptomyces sp. NPDC055085]